MGLGTSLFLIAVGAILRFAVHVSTRGFSVHTVGVILMVVGLTGLAISVFWMTLWSKRRAEVPSYQEPARPVYHRERVTYRDGASVREYH
jgi:sulfite exporter TauE/SafE